MREGQLLAISPEKPEPERVESVAAHLRTGGLIGYPTETVYGFGCGLYPEALARLVRLKRRGAQKPLLLVVRTREDIEGLVWPPGAQALAAAFWPGALTLVLPDPARRFPDPVRSAGGGVAVRATPHPVLRAVLEAFGGPVTSTSANVPGSPPALDARAAHRAALELVEAEGMSGESRGPGHGAGGARDRLPTWFRIVDGGTLSPSESSTIVDFSGPGARIRRFGAVSADAIRAVHPEIDDSEAPG